MAKQAKNGGEIVTTAAAQAAPRSGGLARRDTLDYAFLELVTGDAAADFSEALAANLGGQALRVFDFTRVRVPAGGGKAWEVPNVDTGDVEVATEIEGIIVGYKDQKAFWRTGLDAQGAQQSPPNCYSTDTIRGIGDPGTICAKCPYNQFGSAKDGQGRGKACKDVRFLFILRPTDLLPIVIPTPPTSLGNVKSYFIKLSARAVPYWRAITKFRLVGDKNASGINYSKILPSADAILDGEAAAFARKYSENLRTWLAGNNVRTEAADIYDPAQGQGTAEPGAQSTGEQEGAPIEGEEVTEGAAAADGNRAEDI